MSLKEKLESVKKQIEAIEYQLNSWKAADYRRSLSATQLQAKRDKLVSLKDQQIQTNQAVHDEAMANGAHAKSQKELAERYAAERAQTEEDTQQKALERREALKKHHGGLWKAQGGDSGSFEAAWSGILEEVMVKEGKQKMSQVYRPQL
jgi:peptidoglycan hydrolase CwlO-like protein